MVKRTLIFLFFLSLVATLLLGINIGKKLGKLEIQSIINNVQTTPTFPPPSPTITLIPTAFTSPSATIPEKVKGTSIYTDKTCGFSFSYPGSYLRQRTVNEQSVIFTDPEDSKSAIASTCAPKIPRPPVPSDKIEAISLDGISAILYHDQDPEGNPRDEIIVKHPTNNLEIIIAGYGPIFQKVLSSFKFTSPYITPYITPAG